MPSCRILPRGTESREGSFASGICEDRATLGLDSAGRQAFQKPEQEGHEGNEGQEELLAALGLGCPRGDPARGRAFLKADKEAKEGKGST